MDEINENNSTLSNYYRHIDQGAKLPTSNYFFVIYKALTWMPRTLPSLFTCWM